MANPTEGRPVNQQNFRDACIYLFLFIYVSIKPLLATVPVAHGALSFIMVVCVRRSLLSMRFKVFAALIIAA